MAANTYAATAGTTLKYGTAGSAGTTALGGIQSFSSLPKIEADEFETTRVDQVDGAAHDWFKQFAPDAIDPGTLELKLGLDETQLTTLYTLIRTVKGWTITFSSGGNLGFDGFVKSIGPEANDKGEVLVDVAIRVTGKVTWTAGV